MADKEIKERKLRPISREVLHLLSQSPLVGCAEGETTSKDTDCDGNESNV